MQIGLPDDEKVRQPYFYAGTAFHNTSRKGQDSERNPYMKTENNRQVHEFPPVYNEASQVLILGSFPSVKSREIHFYYGHPQNRFWKVVSSVCGKPLPVSIDEKKAFLLESRIALWDVIESCTITGSSDSSIRNVVPNDIAWLLRQSAVSRIYANGTTAAQLYRKYIQPKTGMEIQCLPSTSPANAAWSLDRLIQAWSCIKEPEYGQV